MRGRELTHARGLTCSVDELRTLFLFEKLDDEQLDWLCREGRVQYIEPGYVYREGEPATCFYVLLDGEVALSRQVGADDVETNRTSQRGVYSGAWNAYLGDRTSQVYNNSMRVTKAVAVLRARCAGVRADDARVVPDGSAPAGRAVLRHPDQPAGDRPARTTAGPRLAVGRAHPRAEQPSRRRGAGHVVVAGTGRRHAAQAGADRGRPVRPGHARDADQLAGRRRRARRQGARI